MIGCFKLVFAAGAVVGGLLLIVIAIWTAFS
jgi:hypothetical protein